MAGGSSDLDCLTEAAQHLVQQAIARCSGDPKGGDLGTHHWLAAVLAGCAPVARALAPHLDLNRLGREVEAALRKGNPGRPLAPDELVREVFGVGSGGVAPGVEAVVAVVLRHHGIKLAPDGAALDAALRKLDDPDRRISLLGARRPTDPSAAGSPTATAGPAPLDGPLVRFGRDLVQEAREGRLWPIIGREQEIRLVTETLCRPEKSNPALIGPAGVGKTAIAEGLARLIADDAAPAVIANRPVIAMPASALTASLTRPGEVEERVQQVVAAAEAAKAILFIDEFHLLVGAGAPYAAGDLANLLKPALARGGFSVMAATTDDEYRQYVERDTALARRFQAIRVQELSPEQTIEVLRLVGQRCPDIEVSDGVLKWMIEFAGRYMPNRHFPDKAIDLLSQSVARVRVENRNVITQADAEDVAMRLVGMPLAGDAPIDRLHDRLLDGGLLSAQEADLLCDRLRVTVRGLDLRYARPNAVILMLDEAAAAADELAATIAEELFGAAERVLSINLGRMTTEWSISELLGASPAYVGYGQPVELHRLLQTPWCVLRLLNVEAAHPVIRHTILQGLIDGVITLADGKRVYLSDVVVVMSAHLGLSAERRSVGFRENTIEEPEELSARVAAELGETFVAEIDLLSIGARRTGSTIQQYVSTQLLPALAERYEHQRLAVKWHEGVVEWLLEQAHNDDDRRHYERILEEQAAPLLIPFLPSAEQPPVSVELMIDETGHLAARPTGHEPT